jgi:quercetin dioxygenase-like cupin family protein
VEYFDLDAEKEFRPERHVEKILATVSSGDSTIACWEPGQISPCHCHPQATEIYLCLQGGGTMWTPDRTVAVRPGTFVVHPPGEVHEYVNGEARSILFRVRYGPDTRSHHWRNRGVPGWVQSATDPEYFRHHPVPAESQ